MATVMGGYALATSLHISGSAAMAVASLIVARFAAGRSSQAVLFNPSRQTLAANEIADTGST